MPETPEKWPTAITEVKPNRIMARGYLIDELMGKITFAQAVYLVLKGDLPSPAVGKLLADGDNLRVKELCLIYAKNSRINIQPFVDLLRRLDRLGIELTAGVRGDFFNRIAIVDRRFENLNFLTCDRSPPQPADQLICFSTEHGNGDDFD